MNKLYKRFSKLFVILFLSGLSFATMAQTTLVKGDIAIVGYIGNGIVAGNDQFSFVLLRDITANTVVNFTDIGWLRNSPTSGTWNSTNAEGIVTWTSNAAYLKGTEIKIEFLSTTTATATFTYLMTSGGAGTATTATIMPSFSTNGDQIIAYQGAVATPTFICAINMNSYNGGTGEPITNTTNWDGNYVTFNACGLPALTSVSPNNFLTNGVDAIWIPGNPALEYDNSRFVCTGTLNTVAGIRTAVYTLANWLLDDDAPSFTLPTGCFTLSAVPVKIISFHAQNNLTNIITKWQVTNEINVSHYEVERSFDGKNFDKIGTVAVQAGAGDKSYSLTDLESLKMASMLIYYRLKSIDVDGKLSYSDIVTVRNNKDESILVDNFANPINDNLNFNLTVKTKGIVIIQITDVNGKIAISKQLQINSGRSSISLQEAATLSKGIYFLRVTTTTGSMVTKFIK